MGAVFEFLYGTRQSAKDSGVSWMEEMSSDLKFIIQCHGNTKEVGGKDSSSENSNSSTLSMEQQYHAPVRRRSINSGLENEIPRNGKSFLHSVEDIKESTYLEQIGEGVELNGGL